MPLAFTVSLPLSQLTLLLTLIASLPIQPSRRRRNSKTRVCVCVYTVYARAGACQQRAWEDVKGTHKVRNKGKRSRQRHSGEQVEGLWFILRGFEREINLCLRRSEAPWSHCVPQIDLEKLMLSSEREGWSLKEKGGGRRNRGMDKRGRWKGRRRRVKKKWWRARRQKMENFQA